MSVTRGFVVYLVAAFLLSAVATFLHPEVTDPIDETGVRGLEVLIAVGIHGSSFLLGLAEMLMHRRGMRITSLFRRGLEDGTYRPAARYYRQGTAITCVPGKTAGRAVRTVT